MLETLIPLLGPILIGAITVPIMQGLKKFVTVLDTAPSYVKQVVVVLIALGLTTLGSLLGIELPDGVELFSAGDVEALLSALLAFSLHGGKKVAPDTAP